ncbi:mediator complex protein-domain-containing protein [Tricladium varicosporioides]|nr:mediator complex protein-domain-containing protein [Hymenoscyphus varicosporioides]
MSVLADASEPSAFQPFTRAERIQQLNDIDKSITQLLHSAGLALKTLTISDTTNPISIADRRKAFEDASNLYLKTLRTVDVGLKRNVYALEEADIIPATAAKPKLKEAKDMFGKSAKPTGPTDSTGDTGMGKLDIGWLNSRSGRVDRDMEAELWAKAKDFLEGIEKGNINGDGDGQDDEDHPMG